MPVARDLTLEELEARLLAPRSPAAVAARHELVEFPAQATDSVIGLRVVNAATERWTSADTEAALALASGGDLTTGVDFARFGGDETVQ